MSVFVFLELEGLGLELGLGVDLGASKLLIADTRYAIHGNRVPVAGTVVPDTRPKIWTVVWIPTQAPPSAKTKTLSIAVCLLSYDAAVFSG